MIGHKKPIVTRGVLWHLFDEAKRTTMSAGSGTRYGRKPTMSTECQPETETGRATRAA